MRNKIKVIATSMLSIALLIISCIATTLLVNAEGNSTVQKGAVAMVDTSTGPTWEGKYGKDGYIIFEGTSGSGSNWTTNVSFYSDLYPNHTGTEIIKGVDVQGRPGGASSYTFLTNEDKNNKNYGMKTDSPISRWGYGTVAWWKNMTDDLAKKSTLCVPGNPEQYTYGTFGRNANTLPNDISIFFTLEAEEKTYVTVYVSDMWDKVSDDKRIKVLLYPTNKVATNSKAEDLDAFYGATPIEQTSLSSNGYITFELEGAGDYQIVVADEKNNTETKPSIQGIFFDSKLLRNARYLTTDATTGTSVWQDKYGKDGYVVFNGAGTSSSGADWRKNVSFYSNLYPDNNGLSVINAYNTNDRNNGKANYTFLTQEDQTNNNYGMSEDSPISRWGYATTVWWGNMTEEFAESHTLRIPGSKPAAYTKGTFGKTVKNNHIKNDLSVLFTLKGNEKINVTVFVSGLQNYEISELNKAEVLVYPTAQLKMSETQKVGEINGTADLNAFYGTQPLAKATITSNCYITFELEGAGDYQIVVADDNTDETVKAACAPSIQGVFFDTIEYYSVTYRNIESGVINDNPDNYAEIETITLKDPIKEGYIFEGWYTTETFDEDTKVTRITKEYGNVTLYAKFKEKQRCTITYELGEHAKINGLMPESYMEGDGVALVAPDLDDYCIFDGWYLSEGLEPDTKVLSISVTDIGDKVLYAKVDYQTFTLTLHSEKETLAYFDTELKKPLFGNNTISFNFYEVIDLPTLYYSDGSEFGGWYEDKGHTIKVSEWVIGGYNTDMDFYALTFEKYTITYHLAGGLNSNENPEAYITGHDIILKDAIKEGYVFLGWYDAEEGGNKVTVIKSDMRADVVLYARFEKSTKSYTITYHLDGGANSEENPMSYTMGSEIILKDAVKDGYNFLGWYDAEEGGNKITAIESDAARDIVLYARFEACSETGSEASGCKGDINGGMVFIGTVSIIIAVILHVQKKKKV